MRPVTWSRILTVLIVDINGTVDIVEVAAVRDVTSAYPFMQTNYARAFESISRVSVSFTSYVILLPVLKSAQCCSRGFSSAAVCNCVAGWAASDITNEPSIRIVGEEVPEGWWWRYQVPSKRRETRAQTIRRHVPDDPNPHVIFRRVGKIAKRDC